MSDLKQKNLELSARQLLLNFFSSQIATHGRVFIGFAALIFTILSIRLTIKTVLNVWQLGIIYFAVFMSGLVIFYVLFRLIGYGYFADSVINAPLSCNLVENESTEQCFIYPLVEKMRDYAFTSGEVKNRRIVGLFPVKWFMSHKEQWKGIVVSIVFSLATTFLFFLLLDLEILSALFY
jgi:hypothetical protein